MHRNSAEIRSLLLLLVGVLVGCAVEPYSMRPGRSEIRRTSVEMSAHFAAVPQVRVVIDGAEALAILDTGAVVNVLSTDFAAELGLTPRPTIGSLRDASGDRTHDHQKVRVGRMSIGESNFFDVDAILHPLHTLNLGLVPDHKSRVRAVVSANLFADALITLDYESGQLRIESGELSEPDGVEVFRFRAPQPGVILLTLQINGTPREFQIDTGATSTFTIPRGLRGELQTLSATVDGGLTSVMGKTVRTEQARLEGAITIGTHRFERPIISLMDTMKPIAGSGFLRRFHVTIDQKNKRIRLVRNSLGDLRMRAIRDPHFAFDAQFKVTDVEFGSPAAAAGLRIGDQIVSINDIERSNVFAASLISAAMQNPTIRVKVRRDSSTIDMTIPVAELLP